MIFFREKDDLIARVTSFAPLDAKNLNYVYRLIHFHVIREKINKKCSKIGH